MSNFDDFWSGVGSDFTGYQIMRMWFPDKEADPKPERITSELSDEEFEELRTRLNGCMPLGSMILDLWDEDVRFEESLPSTWYLEAAFGTADSLADCAESLERFFISQVERLGLDYNQQGEEDLFLDLIRDEARQFVKNWRKNIYSLYTKKNQTI